MVRTAARTGSTRDALRYGFAVGKVRVLTTRVFGKATYERLIDAPDFAEQPKVIDGFSDLMVEVFGEQLGRGARAAVGMAALSGRMAVEIEMIVEVAD